MTQAIETHQGIVVPESVLVKVERKDKYGFVPGLEGEEPADPDELERQVLREEWGPVLALPKPEQSSGIRPPVDESGGVDWGAFGTVDFERHRGNIDRSRTRIQELREQLKDKLILLAIVKERLPREAGLVLKYVRKGILSLEHMASVDMLAAAKLYLQARKQQKQLAAVQEAGGQRKQRAHERWLEALG